ncbi:hypothetical protein EG328_009055 [Venturia inaequalis]|uniref:HTH CENPB-type domain-containing protein n=1 Tax=Venturia inaequalis TaxID=5025 RepID=A0A8H3Z9D1_VENIN|nr:hypothetical protein EG328_009055 [Venturia inaequalis]
MPPTKDQKLNIAVDTALAAFQRGSFPSLQKAAQHYGAPYGRCIRRQKEVPTRSNRPPTNRHLDEAEERSITDWLTQLDAIGTRATLAILESSANYLIWKKNPTSESRIIVSKK